MATLRKDLHDARFTADAVSELLSLSARGALEKEIAVPALRELRRVITAGPDTKEWPTALLTYVFTLGGSCTREQLDTALKRTAASGMMELGLVEDAFGDESESIVAHDSLLRATVDLRPYEAQDDDGEILWWIVSDLPELATGETLDGEHVLGIGGATATLIGITPREKVETALDLGCGCGIQALHAARHARRVIATDISERALAITEFNVALNAPTLPAGHTIQTRQGSMLEPVHGELFDLIVSNPPFVITPRGIEEKKWTYRDGGEEGDTLVADLIRSVDCYLTPGGTAVMLANWEIGEGSEWNARPAQWLKDSSASSLIVQRDTEDPASYASTWIRDGGITTRDARFAPLMNAWLDDFAARRVEAVGFGHVLLRKASEPGVSMQPRVPPFRVFADVATTGAGPLGPRYKDMLATLERLETTSNDQLREMLIARADDVVERRHFTPGEEDPIMIDLVQGGGHGRTLQLDTHTAAIVGVLTGEYPLGTMMDAYATLLDQAGVGDTKEAAHEQIFHTVRALLTWGFLHFAS